MYPDLHLSMRIRIQAAFDNVDPDPKHCMQLDYFLFGHFFLTRKFCSLVQDFEHVKIISELFLLKVYTFLVVRRVSVESIVLYIYARGK